MSNAVIIFAVIAIAVAALFFVRGAKRSTVQAGTIGSLYRDGCFEKALTPGLHRWFDPWDRTEVKVLPTGLVDLAAHQFTVITRDQFSFRVSLTPVVEIVDAQTYHDSGAQRPFFGMPGSVHFPLLQSQASAAVLSHFSNVGLDEFLADPTAGFDQLGAALSAVLPGARLESLLLTSITMPPEIRKMFTEVERAKRDGLAALERSRSEQASLRALANAARMLKDNPDLARLRLLQTAEHSRGAKTFVLGPVADVAGGS